MNSKTYFQKLVEKLGNLYEKEEAQALAFWVFEDVLLIKRAHIRLIDKEISMGELLKLQSVEARLLKGEPIQYIFGYAYFKDFLLKVNPNVLIPRPETEELLDWILEECMDEPSFLDIGTGSGCLAIGMAKYLKAKKVYALDVSEQALETAKQNARDENCEVEFLLGSIFDPGIRQQLQSLPASVWVSNPPYISLDEKVNMHANVLEYEPHLALFVEDNDPLLFYKSITEAFIGSSRARKLYFELSEFYIEALEKWLPQTALKYRLKKDAQGKTRMLKLEK